MIRDERARQIDQASFQGLAAHYTSLVWYRMHNLIPGKGSRHHVEFSMQHLHTHVKGFICGVRDEGHLQLSSISPCEFVTAPKSLGKRQSVCLMLTEGGRPVVMLCGNAFNTFNDLFSEEHSRSTHRMKRTPRIYCAGAQPHFHLDPSRRCHALTLQNILCQLIIVESHPGRLRRPS